MLQPKEKRFCLYLSKDDRTSREPFVPQIPGFFQKSRGSSTLRAGGAIAYNRNRFCTHPAKTMQEIEVTGTIDQQGHIQLDHPLAVSDRKNVSIILLIPDPDEHNDEQYDEPDESILAGFRQALSEVKAGQTIPLSELRFRRAKASCKDGNRSQLFLQAALSDRLTSLHR